MANASIYILAISGLLNVARVSLKMWTKNDYVHPII